MHSQVAKGCKLSAVSGSGDHATVPWRRRYR
jgi:hypothetical protein